MPNSPNVLNYMVGKGLAFWKPVGGVKRALGNAPRFEVQPNFEFLDHISSMQGVGYKDRSVPRALQGVVNFELDEITPENLALGLFGEAEENSDGDMELTIMSVAIVEGELSFLGQNDIGSKFEVVIDRVQIRPGDPIGFISEEWSAISLTGEMLKVTPNAAGFGTVREISDEPST